MSSKLALYEDQMHTKDEAMNKEREEYAVQLEKGRRALDAQIADLQSQLADLETRSRNQRQELEMQVEICRVQVASERDSCWRLTNEILLSKTDANSLRQKISNLEAESSRKDATIIRKDSEIEAMSRALEKNDSLISGMRRQLTISREYLSSKQQVTEF